MLANLYLVCLPLLLSHLSALSQSNPRVATVIASAPTVALVLTRESFRKFVRLVPEVLPLFKAEVATRTLNVRRQMEEKGIKVNVPVEEQQKLLEHELDLLAQVRGGV